MADHVCDECEGTGRAGTWTCDGCGLVYDSEPTDECPECGDAAEATPDPCDTCGGSGEVEPCGTCRRRWCVCDAMYDQGVDR